MAVLRYFSGANILENNMVQTQASAAGTLSSIIFILPGLLMIGYWSGFPFWQTAAICSIGGILGVLYTIPLRRVMVVQSELPYPEGWRRRKSSGSAATAPRTRKTPARRVPPVTRRGSTTSSAAAWWRRCSASGAAASRFSPKASASGSVPGRRRSAFPPVFPWRWSVPAT